jgi:hypothetical protein
VWVESTITRTAGRLAQIRQLEVEDHGADARILGRLDGLVAAGHRLTGNPGLGERVADRLAEERLVVDDEHAGRAGLGHLLSSFSGRPQRMKRERSSS